MALDRTPAEDVVRLAGVLTSAAGAGGADPTHLTVDGFVEIPLDPGAEGAAAFERMLLGFMDQRDTVSPLGYFLTQRDDQPNVTAEIGNITGHRVPGLDIVLLIAIRNRW